MGNKTSRQHRAIEGPPRSTKRQNHVARTILESQVPDRTPIDDETKVALALQQSKVTGPLKKTDHIAILVRLNPARDNALISQYTVEDLIGLIRYELYTSPLEVMVSQTPPADMAEIEDLD